MREVELLEVRLKVDLALQKHELRLEAHNLRVRRRGVSLGVGARQVARAGRQPRVGKRAATGGDGRGDRGPCRRGGHAKLGAEGQRIHIVGVDRGWTTRGRGLQRLEVGEVRVARQVGRRRARARPRQLRTVAERTDARVLILGHLLLHCLERRLDKLCAPSTVKVRRLVTHVRLKRLATRVSRLAYVNQVAIALGHHVGRLQLAPAVRVGELRRQIRREQGGVEGVQADVYLRSVSIA